MKSSVSILLTILAVVATGPAGAAGDPAAGKVKAYTCTGCHGIPGYKNVYPTYHVPKLAGQSETYLVGALEAYRSGARRHPTMNLQAQSLSDRDIADISAWISGLGESSTGSAP